MNHRQAAVGALLGALLATTVARAGGEGPSVEDIKVAESDFNRGREAYKTGSYTEAAEYFESADSHAPNERVLELAIGARDKAGVLDRAATDAQLALERYPNSDRIRKVASPLVDKGRAELLSVVVECDEPCNVLDGARIVPGAPVKRRTIFLTPGDHSVRAAWSEDRGSSKDASGKAGESVTISFTAPPIPVKDVPVTTTPGQAAQPNRVEEKPKGLKPIFFIIGTGATVVLAGVTTWSGLDTIKNPGADAVKEKCAGLGPDCPEYQDGRDRQLRTNILIGATAAVGVATAVVGAFFTNWKGTPAPADQGTASLEPYVAYDRGPSIGATGRF